MRVSLEKACELLNKWKSDEQKVSVVLSGGRASVLTLFCAGEIKKDMLFDSFLISWGVHEWVELSFSGAKFEISDDGRSVHFIYLSSERVIVSVDAS